MKENSTSRDLSIDLTKAIAIAGVITIHVCSAGFTEDIGSVNWLFSLFYGSLTRASVPLFFMCSGALMLDPDRVISVKRLYTKNIPRLLIALFFWAAAYKIYGLALGNDLNFYGISRSFKELIVFKHEFHFYFLHIMLLVYTLLPIMRVFVKNSSKRELQYALLLWLVLGIIYPTVQPFWPFTLLDGIPAQWMLNLTYCAVGYGLLGYYVKKYPATKKLYYATSALFGFLFIFLGTLLMSLKTGVLYEHFLAGSTIGAAALAFGVFGLCARYTQSSKKTAGTSIIVFLSKASFCVYLVHIFFLNELSLHGFSVKFLPSVISAPILVILILISGLFVYWVLARIPIVKKWLI